MMANYPAHINIFSLVRIDDKECLWMQGKDEKTRQLISDRIGTEFVGTAEMDKIIYTILDLEQFTGQEIKIITGNSFENVIEKNYGYIPNKMTRFCTVEMKLKPIFNYLHENNLLPVEMRIGFRGNEKDRIKRALSRISEDGFEYFRTIVGNRGKQNKWGDVKYRKLRFPLAENDLTKGEIYSFWEGKPVRFAYRNNCVMCVNRNPMLISHMTTIDEERRKVEWAKKIENKYSNRFLSDVSMEKILRYSVQGMLFNDDDFSECDYGVCGI